jgi:alkanesulfonate monooxygenase SsuD/methylene tetrahydromethanopterin reductase-like flavin-dependent oxidoreductase (luciferase family)
MKVDGVLMGAAPEEVSTAARELEDLGYDGAFTAEVSHDPFFPALLGGLSTERLELGTGIAVAFARNPMTTANVAYDLQLYTRGRFVLDAMVAPGGAYARVHPGPACDLDVLERRRTARLPRRLLPPHTHDAVL